MIDGSSLQGTEHGTVPQVDKSESERMRMEIEARDNGGQLREMAEKVFQLLERLKLAELAKNKAIEVWFHDRRRRERRARIFASRIIRRAVFGTDSETIFFGRLIEKLRMKEVTIYRETLDFELKH